MFSYVVLHGIFSSILIYNNDTTFSKMRYGMDIWLAPLQKSCFLPISVLRARDGIGVPGMEVAVMKRKPERPSRSAKTLPTTHRRAAGGKRPSRPLKGSDRKVPVRKERWVMLVAL